MTSPQLDINKNDKVSVHLGNDWKELYETNYSYLTKGKGKI